MIIRMPDATSSQVAARLVRLRDEGGAVALGRVLTLVVVATADVEDAIVAANDASREHPCRVIVVDTGGQPGGTDGLDAEIRVGGDAGASEVIVLHPRGGATAELDSLIMPLLLPDAPIVTWWPHEAPDAPSHDPLGAMAQRRITDVTECADGRSRLTTLASTYAPGDTDLAWARTTLWRGLLAAALDEPPHESVQRAVVAGNLEHPSITLLAAWLAEYLRVPVSLQADPGAIALTRVELHRSDGPIVLDRPASSTVLHIVRPSGVAQKVSFPLRTLSDCLVEELRRLDPDEVYGTVLTKGLRRLERRATPA